MNGIQHEGFTVCEEKDELLPIEWAGSRVCNVNGTGGITYDPEQVRRRGLEDALDRLQDGTLWQGHYFNPGEGMDAAKRDFTRARAWNTSLIPSREKSKPLPCSDVTPAIEKSCAFVMAVTSAYF